MAKPRNRTALFRVKRLRWNCHRTRTEEKWSSQTPFGNYEVLRERRNGKCCGSWTPWMWTFISPDLAQADTTEHLTAQLAKDAAERDWKDRLASVLVQVSANKKGPTV